MAIDPVLTHLPQHAQQVLQNVLDLPMHRRLDFNLLEVGDMRAKARFVVGPDHLNAYGVVHGGVWYLLLDVIAYCACMAILEEGLNATTHDMHVSVLRPGIPGQTIELEGEIIRRGKSVIFGESKALCDGKISATARVTKSVIPMREPGE